MSTPKARQKAKDKIEVERETEVEREVETGPEFIDKIECTEDDIEAPSKEDEKQARISELREELAELGAAEVEPLGYDPLDPPHEGEKPKKPSEPLCPPRPGGRRRPAHVPDRVATGPGAQAAYLDVLEVLREGGDPRNSIDKIRARCLKALG